MSLVRGLLGIWVLGMGVTFTSMAQAPATVKLKPEVEAFIGQLVANHNFDEAALRRMFSQLKPNDAVVRAIQTPATSKPWHEFRNLFVSPTRISGGAAFWNDNGELLARARTVYGVPEEVIVSIVGVESIYGKRTGSFRIIDALYTLGFEMPERAAFFRGELEQFLLLARDNGMDPITLKGSFAGAMGMPQFMPTSYRRFAVDFDGDGKVDLWNSNADIIGSVAHYLNHFGWSAGQPVAVPARISGTGFREVIEAGFRPHSTVAQMQAKGVEPTEDLPPETQAGLFAMENQQGQEYWLALNNFYVITRYNRSRNYALAVYLLAQSIVRERANGSTARLPEANAAAAQSAEPASLTSR